MLLNRFLTVTTLLACLQLFSCEGPGDGNTNDGKWELLSELKLFHSPPLKLIKFVDGSNGLALRGSAIESTSDSGKTWTTVFYDETKSIASGTFISETEGWVVGTDNVTKPLVLKTIDGGNRWFEIPFDGKSAEQLSGKIKSLWDICFDPKGTAWMIGEGGILQVQINKEDLRLISMYPTDETSDRISCSDSGGVWAVGRGSSVFLLRQTWVKKELNPRYSSANIRSFKDDVWIIGKDDSGKGILLKSRDSGESWQDETPKSAKALNDLFLRDDTGWLIGVEGRIYNTTDNGETWVESKSPTNANLLHIYSLNLDHAWISGDRETVLKFMK